VLGGDVEPDQDLVHQVGHRADRHGEVDDAGGPVHAAVATHGLAADQGRVGPDGVDELPHRVLERRVFLVEDLEDRRRLVVLDERVVLRPHVVGEPGQDVEVGVHRVDVQGDDLGRLPVARLHLVHRVHVGLGVAHVERAAALLLVHTEDCTGRADGLVDYLLVQRHLYLRESCVVADVVRVLAYRITSLCVSCLTSLRDPISHEHDRSGRPVHAGAAQARASWHSGHRMRGSFFAPFFMGSG